MSEEDEDYLSQLLDQWESIYESFGEDRTAAQIIRLNRAPARFENELSERMRLLRGVRWLNRSA